MKKGFTIIELLLAVTLLAILLVVSGAVFRMAAKAYRTAAATGEIARKLRAITDQIDADFQGLRKDGPIFIAWVPANPSDADGDGDVDTYERFDRIMFFADGDFASYAQGPAGPLVTGDVARITYMLANDSLDQPGVPANRAHAQPAAKRILARSQHIYTADMSLVDDPADAPLTRTNWIDPANIAGVFTQANNNGFEFDNLTLNEWLSLPWADARHILTVATDISVDGYPARGGLSVNAETPLNVHQLLAEGVGAFSVQGWYEPAMRWFPEVDPDADRDLADSDFPLSGGTPAQLDMSAQPLRLIYPWPWDLNPKMAVDGGDGEIVDLGDTVVNTYRRELINRDNFNRIPGLGRALKFTFTLYDSRGVFKDGKTFTHIVYLDD
ncbi:MAG TPA: prepilin-type N-terminal cleavage/methylation domain-containing protein [Anaerohalosphaeraceae bacterium]|nr:prepilin-type N-terminal cleavage/methylation domain-containing protein [Anaerohalosphaeraceae bacterium]HRT50051.1 prepilin-type N-terminal cleavage/methylation domain-containing protein [Anaerohalosphaeraceae bacterium]HRT85854.1 prepilin-type N-terminal cleavage/methylation domain-containing protein [Anaerohalosphaeraceae bacterium]